MENIGLSGAPGSTWFGMRSPELAWWVGTADCIYPEHPGQVGLYRDVKVTYVPRHPGQERLHLGPRSLLQHCQFHSLLVLFFVCLFLF